MRKAAFGTCIQNRMLIFVYICLYDSENFDGISEKYLSNYGVRSIAAALGAFKF